MLSCSLSAASLHSHLCPVKVLGLRALHLPLLLLPASATTGQGSGWDVGPDAASQAPECRNLINQWLRECREARCRLRGIRRAHVPHRGIPVPLQNARVNRGRKISCNMAFCDRREIAKGRKIKKGSVFLSFPFPTRLERLRKCPAIRNNVKKAWYHFPW